MRIFQTLGTDAVDFEPEDLWDEDEDCLSSTGYEVRDFAKANPGACSIDFGDDPESSNENHTAKQLFEGHGLTHNVPISNDWWGHAAKILYDVYHADEEDAAKIFYSLDEAVEDVLDCANGIGENFFYDCDADSESDAYITASRGYLGDQIGYSNLETVEGYMDFEQHGRDNFTVTKFAGAYIVRDDNY